jgi:hypothetical protein
MRNRGPGVVRQQFRHSLARLRFVAGILGALLAAGQAVGEEIPPAPAALPSCDWDDWVISVRHCPQKRTCCAPCDVAVAHLDACGRQSRSSLPEMVSLLQPGVPVCLVLHGSFVPWSVVYEESRRTQTWLRQACPDRPVHLVFFTWPSDETSKVCVPLDVVILGKRSERHAQDIAQVLSQIPDDHPIALLGHSHGARMSIATLHLLAGGRVEGIGLPTGPYHNHRIRAALAAAAFDHDWLNPGERYGRAICRAECILNLRNRHDLPLVFYPLHRPGAARSLARAGFTTADRRALGAESEKLFQVDVTAEVGLRHQWDRYLDEPAIARTLASWVFFADCDSP